VYNEWINKRLTSAYDNTIPLTPFILRVIKKHNKAQNIIVLTSVLLYKELEKRKTKEQRKAKHKKEGLQRRVKTLYSVIQKGQCVKEVIKVIKLIMNIHDYYN
jgi:hypothetical protein